MNVRSQSASALLALAVLVGGVALAGLLAALPFVRLGTLEQTIDTQPV